MKSEVTFVTMVKSALPKGARIGFIRKPFNQDVIKFTIALGDRVATIAASGLELRMNAGKEQMTNLIVEKLATAMHELTKEAA